MSKKINNKRIHNERRKRILDMNPATHKEMILDQKAWPRWPLLPLIRRGPEIGIAVIWSAEITKSKVVIRFVNINTIPETVAEFKQIEAQQYNNVDDLLKDGWIVD